ncbi:MAG: FliI/YscN family ATPase [Paracoccaceae bacterium]|nr:FliI/YscN family ATPase [Paracoccaceae bacterium]
MQGRSLTGLAAEIAAIRPARAVGRVTRAGGGLVHVTGLADAAALGDRVRLESRDGPIAGEIVEIRTDGAEILPEGPGEGLRVGDAALHLGPARVAPHDGWIGRIVDADGSPLDGRSLPPGDTARPLRGLPPPAVARRALGPRLATGMAVFDTILPIVRGQRMGLFAGAGVGKSRLLGALGRQMEADVTVIALIGERGRELREFVERALGPEGMARAVIVVATSDQPPLVRRRALWTAMAVAEHFRDAGRHVLLLADSVTRFAEAHREIALASGEGAALRGYPPSVAHAIMALAERAGPGAEGAAGDITALFAVLVAGSDMDEPVADILRGVLDGHVVLERAIAERGRFPAVDVLRSVSRSLPDCACDDENRLIGIARRRLAAYEDAELMIQSGLYTAGTDGETDTAVASWPALDTFVAEQSPDGPAAAFRRLAACLGQPAPGGAAARPADGKG